jgi:hypothetical protein
MEISFRGLVERGRPPFFTTARDKASSVSSGSSSYSCGRTECVSTLARSDFKVRRKTVFLTMVGLSHAENMARSASRRIADYHQAARKQAVTDDAGLAVVFARVLELDGRAFENDCCVLEVQTTLGKRLCPLAGIERDAHGLL